MVDIDTTQSFSEAASVSYASSHITRLDHQTLCIESHITLVHHTQSSRADKSISIPPKAVEATCCAAKRELNWYERLNIERLFIDEGCESKNL
jgi:acyl-CoA thioesterase FadM